MPRTTPLLLVLVALLLAAPAFAQSPPDHAGDPGPPDHAGPSDHAEASSTAGPPDHAAAAGGQAEAAPTEPTGSESPASETADAAEPDEERETSPNVEADSAPTAGRDGSSRPALPSSESPASGSPRLEASPTTSQKGSSPAPGWNGAFPLLGPAVVVGLLGVGLVARVRLPDAEADEDDPPEEDPPAKDESDEPASPKPGVLGLLTLGRQALDRGEVEAAADWFRTATQAAPERQAAHFCLGLCLAELDRLPEAEAALAEACRLRPGDLEATYAHAQVLARRGDTERALRRLERLADELGDLAKRLRGDEAWTRLHDHPRWLALAGKLDAPAFPAEVDEPPA